MNHLKAKIWHILSKIFKKLTWLSLGTEMCGPKDMEDPVCLKIDDVVKIYHLSM